MSTTITAQSGHTLFVKDITKAEMPSFDKTAPFTKFYAVYNWDESSGVIFMYIGKGHPDAPNQYCVWYARSGAFWSSFGTTIQKAIDGAQKDGWLYA